MSFEVPEIDYTRYTNRQLAAVPLAVLAVALLVIAGWVAMTGAPVTLGIDFTGGAELTVQTTTPQDEIPAAFDRDPTVQPVQAGGVEGASTYIVTFQERPNDPLNVTQLSDQARANLGAPPGNASIVAASQRTSPSFGAAAQRTALLGMVVAFLGMSVLAFLIFRTFIPSIAIVVSAFSDIVIPVAVMNLVGIELSLGTVAALLMLIGYSVDSDILLNNHVLRRSGEFYDSVRRAMRTGVTMTLTSMSAMVVMAVVAFLFGIELLTAIGTVLAIGLAADLMNTYMLNLSLLRYYKLGPGTTEAGSGADREVAAE